MMFAMPGQHTTTRQEYIYLLFARERYWTVTVGEATERVEARSSEEALRAFYDAKLSDIHEDRLTKWTQAFERFVANTRVDNVMKKSGRGRKAEYYSFEQITFPNGKVAECNPSSQEHVIKAEFETVFGLRPEASGLHDWIKRARPKAAEERGWVARVFRGDGEEMELQTDIDDWRWGVPLRAITSVLNQLGTEGWSLVSSSEDKGLYRGADATDESFPARVRILLRRAIPEHA